MHHEVSLLTHYMNSWFGLHLEDHVVMGTLVLVISVLVFIVLRSKPEMIPSTAQSFYEGILKALSNILDDSMGRKGRRFLPFVTSLAVFIFLSNVIGLIPGFTSPTANLNTTAALAVLVFLYYNFHGFKANGWRYLEHFIAPKGPIVMRVVMSLLFIPIEIISHLARPFSLSIRLFVNMFGDHIVLAVFVGLVPFLLPIPLMALGLFVCFIQTLIFVILTIIYLSGSVEHAH